MKAGFFRRVVTVLVLFTVTVTAAAFENQTLHYAARYGDIDAGAVEVRIRAEADGYRVESNAKPNALAKLFGADAHAAVTQFTRDPGDGDAWTLDSGNENHGGDGDDSMRRFRIDRGAGRIEFSDGERRAFNPGDAFEAASFPLLLMLRARDAGVESIANTRVIEVSARRARDYMYDAPVAERIDAPAGEADAWKITRHRVDRPADTVTVYLHQLDHIPLKITVTKSGRTSTLQLTVIDMAGDES